MSLRMKILYNTLVGAWGGFVAWAILDIVLRLRPTNVWLDAVLNGAMVGMCVGTLVSSFGGLMAGRTILVARGLSVGLLTGLGGGILGLLAGEAAFQSGRLISESVLLREVIRAFGWAIFGIGIGVAEGLLTLSPRRFIYGGLGGVIGGFAGGVAFIAIVQMSSLQLMNRAVGFALLGAFIGLFVGLVPVMLREAWLQVISSGRNEGKEFLLDKRVNTIGSADSNDVALFGDTTIAPKHAEIRQENGQFTLRVLKGQTVLVNNSPATNLVLQDGAQIRVGRVKLIFRRKGKA